MSVITIVILIVVCGERETKQKKVPNEHALVSAAPGVGFTHDTHAAAKRFQKRIRD